MAKATVLKCDICGEWDSADNPVRTVTVIGPRPDLCVLDRVRVLEGIGINADDAAKYVRMTDERGPSVGSNLSIKAAVTAWNEKYGPKVAPESDEETEDNEPDELDDSAETAPDSESAGEPVTEVKDNVVSIVDTAEGDHSSAETLPAPEGEAQTGITTSRRRRAK